MADYFGWQSLGGTWRGDLHLTDGRELSLAMIFTEFDGVNFHVVVEATDGQNCVRNETDAEYVSQTKYFKFYFDSYLGGPCWVNGQIAEKYIIHGNMEIHDGANIIHGYYDITYTP